MKLTREYQVTSYGVEIEGMVHDTRIPEIREKFGRVGAHGFLVGMSTGDESQQYKMLGSRWFNQMRGMGLVSNKHVDDILGIKDVGNTVPIATEFQRSGILEASKDEAGLRRLSVKRLINTGMVISAPLETPTVAVYSGHSRHWGEFLTQKVPQKL